MPGIRKIIHVDMDAFYASVEQRDNPFLKGKPVIVGGPPGTRSVVSSCSYEARRYGIRSAMSSAMAYRLCPNAVFIPGRYDVYESVSRQIHEIFYSFSDIVEPLALDEAYLDVTIPKRKYPSATAIAEEIRSAIHNKTGLTASAGVSYNKFLAKCASDYNKPDGLLIITPDNAQKFIDKLDISQFYGIGTVTAARLRQLGIKTGSDLRTLDMGRLMSLMGKSGKFYYDISRGIDNRDVESHRIRKSLGREITLERDTVSLDIIKNTLNEITTDISLSLCRSGLKAKTVTLKIKYHDFNQVTRSISLNDYTDSSQDIFKESVNLLNFTEAGNKHLRLIGVSVSNLNINNPDKMQGQLCLPFEYKEVV